MHIPHFWRAGAVLAAALALSGCNTMPTSSLTQALNIQTGPKTLDLAPAPVNATEWSDGDKEHLKNRAEGYGLVHMPQMEKFLNGLQQKIREEAGVPSWPGKVYITANSGLDAYTQSSGNIYLSLGYLQEAETEDELFALLAHEFAHSYLEYDALRTNVQATDKMADVGTALSLLSQGGDLKNIKGSSNQAVETAMAVFMAYQLSRNLLAPAWSRSQEFAADSMAVQLSIRMGYSVPDGLVRVLERQVAHEQKQDQQKQQERDVLRKAFAQARTQLAADVTSKEKITGQQLSNGIVHGFLGELSFAGEDMSKHLTKVHPDTDKRIAHVNQLHDRLMGEREWPDARSAQWRKLQKTRSVQRVFESYRHATLASNALGSEGPEQARRFARQSRVAETQGHAMPALVMWQAGDERNAAKALQDNMNSSQHRAWRSYMIYAEQMLKQGNAREARRVLDQGFKHFEEAPNAWVEYIGMQVKLKETKKAETLAQECGQRFKGYQPACSRAADPNRHAPKGPASFAWLEELFSR